MPLTRSAAKAIGNDSSKTSDALKEEPFQLSSPPATPPPVKAPPSKAASAKKAGTTANTKQSTENILPSPERSRKRKRATPRKAKSPNESDDDVAEPTQPPTKAQRTKKSSPSSAADSPYTVKLPFIRNAQAAPSKKGDSKKQRGIDLREIALKMGIPGHLDAPRLAYVGYGHIPGTTPFPDLKHPTHEEAEEVYKRLAAVHGEVDLDDPLPPPSLTVAGCGDVPCVLDALVRTFLSSNTSAGLSNKALQGMISRYGTATEGAMAGSVDYNAVYAAGQPALQEAIKGGGMSARKSTSIFKFLGVVHAENQAWYKWKDEQPDLIFTNMCPRQRRFGRSPQETERLAFEDLKSNPLSLEYINLLPTQDAILHMVEYHGIGIKTAACVALYCLRRQVFPVDTHVQRFCQGLGWTQANAKGKYDVTDTFSHNEFMLPDHLKYGLHDLFWKHGTTCKKCRAGATEKSAGELECPLDGLVDRERMRGGEGAAAGGKKGKTKVEQPDDDLEAEVEEEVEESFKKQKRRS